MAKKRPDGRYKASIVIGSVKYFSQNGLQALI